jgi:hypothetical protein
MKLTNPFTTPDVKDVVAVHRSERRQSFMLLFVGAIFVVALLQGYRYFRPYLEFRETPEVAPAPSVVTEHLTPEMKAQREAHEKMKIRLEELTSSTTPASEVDLQKRAGELTSSVVMATLSSSTKAQLLRERLMELDSKK